MAAILPIRAWRYNPEIFPSVDGLTSPLFDVVSEKQRASLYKNPYNSIHLSFPEKMASTLHTAELLNNWKKGGILLQDPAPSIYVYYQYFSLQGSSKEYCRKGFVCNIKAYDWNEQLILRHENTIPRSVDDRLELLQETQMNVSPTHGLYTDPSFSLEKHMDKSMKNPVYETEDYQGVRDALSIIDEPEIIKEFVGLLKSKQVILADGHHRFEASLLYRKEQIDKNPHHTGQEGYNYHMMYLTNTESDDLRILPTHRLISGVEDFNEAEFLKKLQPYFTLQELDSPYDISTIILGKKWAFGLLLKENAFIIRLKPEVFDQMTWKMPPAIKELDLTVLHYFIIEKALGIKGKDQRRSEKITFERNFASSLAQVMTQEAQFGLIIKDISMEDIKKVCYSGYTMPQKSTYFYPKVVSGFLFSSIKNDEFKIPAYISL